MKGAKGAGRAAGPAAEPPRRAEPACFGEAETACGPGLRLAGGLYGGDWASGCLCVLYIYLRCEQAFFTEIPVLLAFSIHNRYHIIIQSVHRRRLFRGKSTRKAQSSRYFPLSRGHPPGLWRGKSAINETVIRNGRREKPMKNLKKLTILHSNDMHGDFLAEQIDERLVGGVSLLSGYVNKVRREEKNVIYAVAGDMFRGSVIDSEYKGTSTIGIMNLVGPDVATIGNHEVDYGLAHLLFLEKCADFPIINANLHIKSNGRRMFRPFWVAQIDDMKILFIGIITEEVLAATKSDELIGSFVDIGEAAQEVGNICNAYNAIDIDFTVLLTHIGFEEDKKLAALLDPDWGVDVIIGGHSHTTMEEPCKVNDIYIVQAGTGTDEIGRFDIMVDTDLNAIDTFTWQMIPIDDAHCPRDEEVEAFIQRYKTSTSEKYDRIITRFACELTHPQRNRETPLGNLISDILRDSFGIDLMLMGSGAIRSLKLGPVVHYADLAECLPYDDAVYMLKVTGTQLERMIRHILRDEAFQGEHTEFYQFSHGTRIVWSRSEQAFRTLTLDGEPLVPDRLYTVALQKYHYNNLKPFLDITLEEVEKNGKIRVLSTSARDVVEEYLMVNQHLKREVEGRLVVLD